MRQTLFRVLLDQPWTVWGVDHQTGIEGVGIGIVALALGLIWVLLALVPSRAQAAVTEKRGKSKARNEQSIARPVRSELIKRAAVVAGVAILLSTPVLGILTGHGGISGTARPSIVADGRQVHETYTFTALSSGTIGTTSELQVEVSDQTGTPVRVLDVGSGYEAGTPLELSDGIALILTSGNLNEGDAFSSQIMNSFPIFGYGFMTLVGFVSGILFTLRRARLEGFDQETIIDLAMYVLVPGIVGGRLAYLVQYWDRVFGGKSGFDLVTAAINLPDGGLVLMGAMAGGAIGFYLFCHLRKINPLKMADVVVPSAFLGIGFGRLGCLLNGCCFGDPCSLPWAITFPQDSVPFNVLAQRGFVDPSALATMPVHPTQIYSALNGFILAFVTAIYFHRRRQVGDVFALGLILYPFTRFTIEFLRNDELGKLGTDLTISQIYSLVMCAAGIGLYAYLNLRGREASGAGSLAPRASG